MYQDMQVWFGSRQRNCMINCIKHRRLNSICLTLLTMPDAMFPTDLQLPSGPFPIKHSHACEVFKISRRRDFLYNNTSPFAQHAFLEKRVFSESALSVSLYQASYGELCEMSVCYPSVVCTYKLYLATETQIHLTMHSILQDIDRT